jgi:hypothetical protein
VSTKNWLGICKPLKPESREYKHRVLFLRVLTVDILRRVKLIGWIILTTAVDESGECSVSKVCIISWYTDPPLLEPLFRKWLVNSRLYCAITTHPQIINDPSSMRTYTTDEMTELV